MFICRFANLQKNSTGIKKANKECIILVFPLFFRTMQKLKILKLVALFLFIGFHSNIIMNGYS